MSAFSVMRNVTIAAFVALAIVAIAANIKLPVGYKLLVVQSGSMEPRIGVGSVLLTKPTADFAAPMPNARFLKGDVITYAIGKNNFVSHRVVDVQEKDGQFFYQTKGDANPAADQKLIPENEVVGRAALTVPYLGRFVNFAKTPLGYFLMIMIPSLYVIFSEVWSIITEIRKSRLKISLFGTGIALPMVLVVATSIYFIGGTAAFFSDTATSSGNVFEAASSFANEPFADDVTAVVGTFGHCCSDLSSDPAVAKPLVTGAPDSPPDADFIQISDNSSVTLKFVDNRALPTGNSNPDIRVHIYDTLFPAQAKIEVSQDGSTWYDLENHFDTADVDLNIESTGLAEVKYVRITDLVAGGDPFPTLGFDLDAVEALNSAPD